MLFAQDGSTALDSVKQLNTLSEDIIDQDPDSAYLLANAALSIAIRQDLRSAQAVSLKRMGNALAVSGKPDSARICYFESLGLYESIEGKEAGIIQMLLEISESYSIQGTYDKALKYAHRAATESASNQLPKLSGISHNQLGEIHFSTGMYTEALRNFYAALQHSGTAGYEKGVANAEANLGKTYSQLGNYILAEKFLYQAYDHYLEHEGEASTGRVLANIANMYLLQADYDRALAGYLQSLQIKRQNNDFQGIANTLNNIGMVHFEQGNYDSARVYFDKALALKEEIGDRKGISSTLNNLGALSLRTGNTTRARVLLEKGLEEANAVNAREYTMEALELLSDLYAIEGNKLRSLEFHKRFTLVQNELYGAENQQRMAVMHEQFEIGNKEKELLEVRNTNQELELSKEKYRRSFLLALLLSLFILLTIIIYRYTIVRKLTQLLRRRERQKDELLKELNHRVKNNLQIVSSILRIQSRRIADPDAVKAILEGQNRVEAMALVHKELYSGDDAAEIELDPFLRKLTENAVLFCGKGQPSMDIDIGTEGLCTDASKAVLLGLIINELISNAFKHADADLPRIFISIHSSGQGSLQVCIKDNGPGLPRDFDPARSQGFGMKLVSSFASRLDASIAFNTGPGAEIRLDIPGITFKCNSHG